MTQSTTDCDGRFFALWPCILSCDSCGHVYAADVVLEPGVDSRRHDGNVRSGSATARSHFAKRSCEARCTSDAFQTSAVPGDRSRAGRRHTSRSHLRCEGERGAQETCCHWRSDRCCSWERTGATAHERMFAHDIIAACAAGKLLVVEVSAVIGVVVGSIGGYFWPVRMAR